MTKGLLVLMLAGYALTLWISYEIIKSAVKDALIELSAVKDAFRKLKAAEKAKAEKATEEVK